MSAVDGSLICESTPDRFAARLIVVDGSANPIRWAMLANSEPVSLTAAIGAVDALHLHLVVVRDDAPAIGTKQLQLRARCGCLARVIGRLVLRALAAGVAAGDDNVARAALRGADWVLRGAARRRLEHAVVDAAHGSGEVVGSDPEATRHVLMTAALTVADRYCAPTNRTSVAVEYAAMPRLAVPRLWIATLGAAMLVTAAVTMVVALVAWSPRTAFRPRPRPLPAPAAGAFLEGGQPLVDPAIAELLTQDLIELLGEIDADRRSGGHSARRQAHGARLSVAPAVVAHGPALAEAWQAMILALERWVDLPSSGDDFEREGGELIRIVRALSDALVAADIGYYLEGNVVSLADGAHVIVASYRVEEVVFVNAGGVPRRVLSLRRLDRINYAHALLGMESAELGAAVLLLDQIDQHVATRTLRLLAPDAPYPLGDAAWTALPDGRQVAAAAGNAARRELVRWLGDDDAETGAEIARLLDERAALLEQWRAKLASRDQVLYRVDTLFLPDRFVEQLAGEVPSRQRERASAIEAELARLDAPRIAQRLHQLVATTTRRHEAQHGFDEARGSRMTYPAQVASYIGPMVHPDGAQRRHAWRVRAELSGYLSQIANDPVAPQLAYWDLVGSAFDAGAWGNPESFVAVIISEGLARALKLSSAPVIHDRQIDRVRLAALGIAIARQSDQALRDAAEATWRELFGEPITRIVDRPDQFEPGGAEEPEPGPGDGK